MLHSRRQTPNEVIEIKTIDIKRVELLKGVCKTRENKELLNKIEEHFFKKGYEYALLHFNSAVKGLKVNSELEKKILDEYMDFLK